MCLGRVLDTARNLILPRVQLEDPWYMDRHLHKGWLRACLSTGARAAPLCKAIQQPSCWTSNYPPSCSRQENICRCLPCPTHKNKWAKQSRAAPKCNSDTLFISQNIKKCWIVLDFWGQKKKNKKEPMLGQTYRADYAHGVPGLW